ncbi:MAG: diacylglycerol/lipid kinase family protein, partial [Brachybacterium tyrofermentans]
DGPPAGAARAAGGAEADADPHDASPADSIHRVAVVLNPSKFQDAEMFRTRVREVVEKLGDAEVAFYETTVEDPGRGQTRRALQEGADLVVAAGGDGTVRLVSSVLAGTETRMAIIPAGTGNLLARNLDIPLEDPTAAITAALSGKDRRIDVGWLRSGGSVSEAAASAEQIFLVIAGFGADAEMIGHTDDTLKKRLGWIAYVVGGVRTILGRSVDVMLDFPDGTRQAHKARTVLLGNVGRLPGGFVLMPDATADNGRLEIVVAGWKGAAGFSQVLTEVVTPKLVPKGRFAERTRLSTMNRYQATEVRVATTKAQPVQLDGDTDAEATHLIARIDPGVLRLRVPAGTERDQP